jgi:hypothetical protein
MRESRQKENLMSDRDDDDDLMDLYLLGILDDHNDGGPKNDGGCLTSFALMIAVPVMVIVGIVSMVA